MAALQTRETDGWKDGYVSGAVYHGDTAHIDFLNQVYALHSQTNPLHADVWPSISKYEAEIVAMTAGMLGGDKAGEEICGTLSSGGTESIMLAMKTYRDRARAERGIRRPEMVVPITAHAAFDKAAQYFGIKMVRIPVDQDYRADIRAAARAITRRTVVVVGSAPSFPHGMVDPIAELSELARQRGIGFHTDACLGGFVLPWAADLGYPVPPFDFQLPGVTSISADTHKYGYAAKGTSVILYRGPELRRHQYFTITDWPGGLYFSPSFAGSRPGALSAACWAAMVRIGQKGYQGRHPAHPGNRRFHQNRYPQHTGALYPGRPALGHRLRIPHAGYLPRHGCHEPPRMEPERPAPPQLRAPVRHAAPHPAGRQGTLCGRPAGRRGRSEKGPRGRGGHGAGLRHGRHPAPAGRCQQYPQGLHGRAL
jgi:glutamate/tyrosine decarboxylase-like PLP-dependent enzyme